MAHLILLSTGGRNLESSYLYIAMRQFAMFGGLQLGREREVFSTKINLFFITINFQEISDFISALKSLPVTDLEPQATT